MINCSVRFHRVFCRRFAGAHHAIDGDSCRSLVGSFVNSQGLRDIGALIKIVGIKRRDMSNFCLAKLAKECLGHLFVGRGKDFSRGSVDHVFRQGTAQDKIIWHGNSLHASSFHIPDMLDGDSLVFLDNHLSGLIDEIKARHFTAESLGHQFKLHAGIGNLVDADLAKESARLQALQVQQQLGVQALSIANQAPQVILSLFKG